MTYLLLILPKYIIKGGHKGNGFYKRLYIFLVNLYMSHPLLKKKKKNPRIFVIKDKRY